MSDPLKQVVDENYSNLPYHNAETEKIQAERTKELAEPQKPAEEHSTASE